MANEIWVAVFLPPSTLTARSICFISIFTEQLAKALLARYVFFYALNTSCLSDTSQVRVVEHKRFGKVFAFEVDGYGGHILMDDANVPSLLALPTMGFVENSDPVYVNTRKMILNKAGNPYYLEGKAFRGIGG